jgi:hypothetical protein
VRTRVTFAVLFALVTAVVTVAVAQPRGRGAGPKPKPPGKVDAGVEAPVADEAAGTAAVPTAAAPATGDAGPTAGPAAPPSYYDGGQKPSPLNPAPNELPAGAPPAAGTTVDYDKLLGDISALRARVATVGDGLFHSRIAVAVQTDGDHGKIARMTVSLDEGVVYTAAPGFRADDMTLVYDHAVAPGRHAVTIDVERKDDREESFRTAQRSRLVVDVPKDQKLSLEVRVLDDSTMGADFPGDRSGKYDLRIRARATARPVGK